MSDEKVSQAIQKIKAGDRQGGQVLLAEVLAADPGNETAWLWMSGLVSGEKQRYCLEKALSLNPGNAPARRQLEQLQAAAAGSPAATPSAPQPAGVAAGAPVQENRPGQCWVIRNRYAPAIIYIQGNELLACGVPRLIAWRLTPKLEQGVPPRELYEQRGGLGLIGVTYLKLDRIRQVIMFSGILKLTYLDEAGQEQEASIRGNERAASEALDELQARLGPRFQRSSRQISRGRTIVSAIALMLVCLLGTGLFYWLAQVLALPDGSLLQRLGPNGVLGVGGVGLLITIVGSIFTISDPPEEIVLSRGT